MRRSSNPAIERLIQFFCLPDCYFKIRKNEEFKKSGKTSRSRLVFDLWTLFFSYKLFPKIYFWCRLWEVDRSQWKYYYGYQTYQKARLRSTVEPREYDILFDDKTVCEHLCRGIGVNNLPHTYGLLRPGQNYIEEIRSLCKISAAPPLIIKPVRGHAGRDIVLVKMIDGAIMVQSKGELIPLEYFTLAKPSIVQELVKQDRTMAAFSSSSVNTIRVLTMYTKTESVIVLAASMLCGVGDSYVSNWSAGGVEVGIDTTTGRLMKYAYDKNATRYTEHPTSRITFEGFQIPKWQAIKDLAIKVQKGFVFYRMLGTDIALREDGEPVVIEVNNDPGFSGMEQTCPLLQAKQNRKAFGEYDLFINKHQRELYADKKETEGV
jgi:hypothetical protein